MHELLLLAFAVLGAVCGSFIGVFAERLHTGHSWFDGRSACNACARLLDAFDLMPVLSWMIFAGRCRTCRSPIPVRYVLIEAALGVSFALAYAKLGLTLSLPVLLLALLVLAFVVLYDLRHTIVPPAASISLSVLALLFTTLSFGFSMDLGSALIYAGTIAAAFLALHVFSRGRAMGLGDAPIAFALSLLVFPFALSGLVFSFWIGGIIGIGILLLRRGGPTMGIEVPFVPFMAAGYLLAYFTTWNPFFF